MKARTKSRRPKTSSPVKGRAQLTQAAFIAVATRAFCEQGYDQTGLRDIAKRVGADKRLIGRYFGSKERLLAETLRAAALKFTASPADFPHLGRRFATRIFGDSELTKGDRLGFINLCIHAAVSATGKRLVRNNVGEQVEHFAAHLKGEPDASSRAAVLLAVFFGISLLREVLKLPQLVELSPEQALAYVAPLLQRLVDPSGSMREPQASSPHIGQS